MIRRAVTPTGARRTPLRRWVLPTCLSFVALCLAITAAVLTHDDRASAAPDPAPTTVAEASTTPAPSTPVDDEVEHVPVSISIASIGVASDLVRLGLQPDRTVEVPEDPAKAGWYELGAAPGQIGAAVILGHVDSAKGPAVFQRLGELSPGDRIRVHMKTGGDELFEVSRVETVPNADFPATEVYGSQDRPTLTLVTCGGEYDKSRGGYQANVIVYTKHIGTKRL